MASKGIRNLVEDEVIKPITQNPDSYHPFQIWPISKYLSHLNLNLTSAYGSIGDDKPRLEKLGALNWPHCMERMNAFKSSEFCKKFNTQLLPLLLWIESYYLPRVRAPRPGKVTLRNCNLVEWNDWKMANDPKAWLEEHDIKLEQLVKWRDALLLHAYHIDPDPNLYILLRSMPSNQRDRFRGKLRLAYDLYEIAELMRLFIEDISNSSIRKEWDPRGHPASVWVEDLYGSQPRFGDPEFLRAVVRHHGLDPAFRVVWLVEGQTEEGFIKEYARRSGWGLESFVSIQNFGGDGAFQKKLSAVNASLQSARNSQCFVTVTFDWSTRARNRIEGLVDQDLISLPFVLHEPEIERALFTIDELVEVAVSWADDLQKTIEMSRKDLALKVASRVGLKGGTFHKAINDILRMSGHDFELGKGIEWGSRLAKFLNDKRESEYQAGIYSEDRISGFEKQIFRVQRSSEPFIDYPLSISDLDSSRLEIVPNVLVEFGKGSD